MIQTKQAVLLFICLHSAMSLYAAACCFSSYDTRRLHSFLNKGRRPGYADPTSVPDEVVTPPVLVVAADATAEDVAAASAGAGASVGAGAATGADAAELVEDDCAISLKHCSLSWFGQGDMSKGEGASQREISKPACSVVAYACRGVADVV